MVPPTQTARSRGNRYRELRQRPPHDPDLDPAPAVMGQHAVHRRGDRVAGERARARVDRHHPRRDRSRPRLCAGDQDPHPRTDPHGAAAADQERRSRPAGDRLARSRRDLGVAAGQRQPLRPATTARSRCSSCTPRRTSRSRPGSRTRSSRPSGRVPDEVVAACGRVPDGRRSSRPAGVCRTRSPRL